MEASAVPILLLPDGKEEYKREKRPGLWLWFALLCAIEVLRRLFAAGSLDSVWFLGVLDGCWLGSWNTVLPILSSV